MIAFLNRLRRLILRPSQSEAAHPFDRAHGVDTSGLYYADRLPTGHAHDRYSEGYYATAPSLFRRLMAEWQATLPAIGRPVEDYIFIDLGCGKGRVVLMASEYPFRAVRGIELNAGLARIARRNLRKWMRRHGAGGAGGLSVAQGDVLDLAAGVVSENGPVVLFLFNSFAAEVVRALVAKLADAARGRGAPIDLIYVHPDHDAVVAQTPGIELLRYGEFPFSEEDARADMFGVCSDVCSIWRLRGSASATS